MIELLYWCFQTVLCQVVKPSLAQSIRPFARSHRDPCTSACTNVTVACLRGQRRRAADACITGAVLVCLVRSVTLATCVMWRRPCASEQGTCTPVCTDTWHEPGEVAFVPDGHQELRRQLLPRGGNNTNPKRLQLFSRRLGGWASELETASRRGAITKMLF